MLRITKAQILNRDLFRRAAMIGVVSAGLTVAACATDGDNAPTPTPTDTPTPTPTGTPTPTPTAVGVVGGATQPTEGANTNTPGPLASKTASFVDRPTSGESDFPLLQASRVTTYDATTGYVTANQGDGPTDSGGAIIAVTWDPSADNSKVYFTLGNSALGVTKVDMGYLNTVDMSTLRSVSLPDGRTLQLDVENAWNDGSGSATGTGTLSYLVYGYWDIENTAGQVTNGSQFVTGFETPGSAIPTTGSATYTGLVNGSVTVPNNTGVTSAALTGNASMTANFATGAITGATSNMKAGSDAWNELTFNGKMTGGGINSFSGATTASSAPTGTYSLKSTAAGYFAGKFYGAEAEELGAVWTLSDGTGAATGVLVGKK
jgi:hypothetical protein